jgi:hypothetical protein
MFKTFSIDDNPAEDFGKWREGRDRWYVINCLSPHDWVLHKATCLHFDYDQKVNFSLRTKYCSEHLGELLVLAQEGNHPLRKCKTCM